MAPGFNDDEQDLHDSPGRNDEIIDESELKLIRQLKDLKKDYRDIYNGIKDLKSHINFSQQSIDSAKQKLVQEFEKWYLETFEDPATLGTTMSSPSLMSPVKSALDVSFLFY